ncbi:hypothetical protein ZWY2020_022036 [Hordeum vulgare]|nr:hypothetical protein ZWY2020_022036 [Hordeum vulgare]
MRGRQRSVRSYASPHLTTPRTPMPMPMPTDRYDVGLGLAGHGGVQGTRALCGRLRRQRHAGWAVGVSPEEREGNRVRAPRRRPPLAPPPPAAPPTCRAALSQPRIPTMASRTAVVVVAVTALLFAAASAQEMDMGMPPAPAPVTGAAAGAAASALAVACSAVLSLLVAGGLAH